MPGYILHVTEAEIICRLLRDQGIDLEESWIHTFKLGNLLPDTKRKTEKVTSHFWDPNTLERLAIPPDMERFYRKYKNQMQGPLMLGYKTHLQMDHDFVCDFWDTILEFQDDQGRRAELKKDITRVLVKKSGTVLPERVFFSDAFYYGDYTRMNRYFLEKYRLQAPVYEAGLFCPVEEVEVQELQAVLGELSMLTEKQTGEAETDLKVFSLKALEAFVEKEALESVRWMLEEHLV